MSRMKQLLLIALIVAIVGSVGSVLAVLVRHEPTFYVRNEVPEGKERKELSTAYLGQAAKLITYLLDSPSEPWQITFSEAQINSYFLEDFVRLGDAENLRKSGITEPRIRIEKDRMRLGFRYTTAVGSAVCSIDMRVWLVPKELNVFAVEVLSYHVGALPFSVQSLRDDITALVRRQNIEVTWYRHEGHPVALLRVQSDRPRPTTKFLRLDTQPGAVTVGGMSLELPPSAAVKKALAPLGN